MAQKRTIDFSEQIIPQANPTAQYARTLAQMVPNVGQMTRPVPPRAAPYQRQLEQARVDNQAFNNQLSTASNMINQLNRFVPNAQTNMLVPNVLAANLTSNTRAPSVVPSSMAKVGTSIIAPVLDENTTVIPDPVPSTSAGKQGFYLTLKLHLYILQEIVTYLFVF